MREAKIYCLLHTVPRPAGVAHKSLRNKHPPKRPNDIIMNLIVESKKLFMLYCIKISRQECQARNGHAFNNVDLFFVIKI